MKKRIFFSLLGVALLVVSCNQKGVTNKSLETEIDSVSYAIGIDVARNVEKMFTDGDFNNDLFVQGYRNALGDSTNLLIDKSESQKLVQAYMAKKRQEMMQKQQEEAAKKAEEEFADLKAAGEKLMEENSSKEGVQVTDSGLQYIVLEEGEGEKPTATSRVKVHYHGTLFDGTVFDSSVDRGNPSTFGLNQVVKGWTEGIQLMSIGSKYKFFLPQELAYGHQKRGQYIKPFSPLVFEIELLEIVK